MLAYYHTFVFVHTIKGLVVLSPSGRNALPPATGDISQKQARHPRVRIGDSVYLYFIHRAAKHCERTAEINAFRTESCLQNVQDEL